MLKESSFWGTFQSQQACILLQVYVQTSRSHAGFLIHCVFFPSQLCICSCCKEPVFSCCPMSQVQSVLEKLAVTLASVLMMGQLK